MDSGGAVDPGHLLETARLAIIQRDYETARKVVDRLRSDAPSPRVTQLEAELQFRQGQPSEVERLLATIDLDQVEEPIRTQIVRRRTMNLLYGLMEDELPFELLEPEIARAEGDARIGLESHRLALQVMTSNLIDGRNAGNELLPETEGYIRLEVLRSLAYTNWAVGRPSESLQRVEEAKQLAAELGPSLSRPGLDLVRLAEIFSLCLLGRVPEARRLADEIGVAVSFGWLPVSIARVAIFEARPSAALESLTNHTGRRRRPSRSGERRL